MDEPLGIPLRNVKKKIQKSIPVSYLIFLSARLPAGSSGGEEEPDGPERGAGDTQGAGGQVRGPHYHFNLPLKHRSSILSNIFCTVPKAVWKIF